MSVYHLVTVARADLSRTSLPARRRLAAKSVLKVFADYANEHDMAWPHVKTIALEAGCGPDVVSEATAACVQANLLRKRKTHTGNKYVLNMKLLKAVGVPRPPRPNLDFPQFDDLDLHENPAGYPAEPTTSHQDPSEPITPSDQRLWVKPKTVMGLTEDGFRQSRCRTTKELPGNYQPNQGPRPALRDRLRTAPDWVTVAGWLNPQPQAGRTPCRRAGTPPCLSSLSRPRSGLRSPPRLLRLSLPRRCVQVPVCWLACGRVMVDGCRRRRCGPGHRS